MIRSQTVPQFVPSIRGAGAAITQLKEFVDVRRLGALQDPKKLICLTIPAQWLIFSPQIVSRSREAPPTGGTTSREQ